MVNLSKNVRHNIGLVIVGLGVQLAGEVVGESANGWLHAQDCDGGGKASSTFPGGWLTTVVARVCLDVLRSRKSRREEPLDPHAEPLAGREPAINPEQEALLADSVADPAYRSHRIDTFGSMTRHFIEPEWLDELAKVMTTCNTGGFIQQVT
jgi:hypothetical protein